MKNTITILLCFLSNISIIIAQPVIKDKDFLNFLSHFYDIKLPFNYKKEDIRIRKGEVVLKEMSEKDAIRYLQKKDSELYYFKEVYNYDTDEKKKTKELNLPVYQFKIFAKDYVLICTRELLGEQADTTIIGLYTLSFDGMLKDKLQIKEQTTPEFDWTSFVLLNENSIKTFCYLINKENYDDKYKIKIKDKPKTILSIYDIEIDKNGMFMHPKEDSKFFLIEDIFFYKFFHYDSDDPMSKYYPR